MPSASETTTGVIQPEAIETTEYSTQTSFGSETTPTSSLAPMTEIPTASQTSMEIVSLTSSATSGVPEATTKESCEPMNYMPMLIDSNYISTLPDTNLDLTKLTSTGVDLTDKNQMLVSKLPNGGVRIQSIEVGSQNINTIVVTITTSSGATVTRQGENTRNLSTKDLPAEKVVNFTVEFMPADNTQPAKGVTLVVYGCAEDATTPVPQGNSHILLCLPYPNL